MSEGRSWKDVMPCPRCGAPTDLATIKLVVCTECDWDSNKSDHATRSDLSGTPTPMEQKWLDMIAEERRKLESKSVDLERIRKLSEAQLREKFRVEDEFPHISVGGLAVDAGLYTADEE